MRRRACRTRTRSKATSRTCRGSTSPTAPASSCIRRRGTSASSRSRYFIEQKDGAARPSSSRSASTARRWPASPIDVTLTQIQWNSVRRAEGNGFYTWDTRAQGSAVGRVAPDERGASRCRSTSRCRPAATSSSRRAPTPTQGRYAVTRDVVLRARRRLHGVAALRPQPHRSRRPSARPTSRARPRGS